MTLLNFDSPEPRRKSGKKSFKALVGIGAIVGAVAIGSTFAASINLNSSGPVEFGQGVTQATACDSEIVMTPYSAFINGTPGSFNLIALKLEGIDTTDQANSSPGCEGKTFTIKLYKANGQLIGTSFTIAVLENNEFFSEDGNRERG